MKFITLQALLCLSLCAGAQIHWAIKAGAQLSGAHYTKDGTKYSTGTIAGLQAGVLAKIYFDDKVAFVTGLQYNAKGFTVKTIPVDSQRTYHMNYAEIPVMVQFDLSRERGNGFYCKAGPALGIGIYGKEMYTPANGVQVHNKLVLSLVGNHYGVFDAALNAAVGYSSKNRFFAEFSYAYGIGNLYNDPSGPNVKSRALSVNLGYFLR